MHNILKENLEKKKNVIVICFTIAFIYILAFVIGHPIGCIFEKVIGISCLSCGMTTAWYYVLQGNLQLAFYFHPLFWLAPILFILLFIDNFLLIKNSKKIETIIILIICIFIFVYLIRITGYTTAFAPLVIGGELQW